MLHSDLIHRVEKHQGLKCMYTNTDTLTNKMEELEIQLYKEDIDIVAICETLPKNCDDNEIFNFDTISGYKCIDIQKGRGVCIFIKNSLQFTRCYNYESLFSPSVFIRVHISNNESFVLGVIYRSPNSDNELNNAFLNQLELVTKECNKFNDKLIIMGDFNLPEIDWNTESCNKAHDHIASNFIEFLKTNDMCQFVNTTTHHRALQKPTIIDLVMSNDHDFAYNFKYNSPLGLSHHEVICFNLNYEKPISRINPVLKYQLKLANYSGMRKHMSKIDWDVLLKDDKDVDGLWEVISSEIQIAKDKFIPKKMYKNSNQFKRSFMVSDTLHNKIKSKRSAFKYYKKYPTVLNYNTYAKLRNQVKWACKKAKREREQKVADDAKTNPKAFYQYVASKTKSKETIPNLQKSNGSLTEDDLGKAEELNNFFSSVFTADDADTIPSPDPKSSVNIIDFVLDNDQMSLALKALKQGKSPGPDSIHPIILKNLAEELAHPLTILFNSTLNVGKLPKAWKMAEVRPIFKKGCKSSPGNYRPVSLTSVVCKVFEGFIKEALCNHLNKNYLSNDQFGFCRGRSCTTQLISTINDWMKCLDDRTPVDAVYLDFRKAFDTVSHKRLLSKLISYGIHGKIFNWIKDFLSDRSQYVTVNGKDSQCNPVTSGVPQGSVLGPILFIYFINDLPDVVDCSIKIFADDTKIYLPIYSKEDSEKLQNNIDSLIEWSDRWLLRFNIDKCKILHIGDANPKFEYVMKEKDTLVNLKSTECEKDLGVYVDSKLKFDQHINATIRKSKNICFLIMRNIHFKSPHIMVPLFKALVRPILEYGNAVWCPYTRKDINAIEEVQRYYTKRIIGMKNLEYEDRLSKLRLPSLESRRIRGDMIEVFKITNKNYDTVTTNTFFEFSDNITRNNGKKLTKTQVNYKQFQEFFTNRIINMWNSLPGEVVNSDCVNGFKNAFDDLFCSHMYKINLSISKYEVSTGCFT